MLILVDLTSEAKVFHLVTAIAGSNSTSVSTMVPLIKVPLCTLSVTARQHPKLRLAHTIRRKSLLYSVTITPLEHRKRFAFEC